MHEATTPERTDLLALALGYAQGGLSLLPCLSKNKKPDSRLLPRDKDGKPTWKPYQTEPADETTVRQWFELGCDAVAAICGKASGGLLVLDFDVPGFYERWCEKCGSHADTLPVQRTGSGGYQVWLRCLDPGGNVQLAWAPDETEKSGRTVAIETRASGGYAILPGSIHPSGNRYEVVQGNFASIPMVSQDVADALLLAARALDQCPLTQKQQERENSARQKPRRQRGGQLSVIETYNAAISINEILAANGYIGRGDRYVRPGGASASVTIRDDRSFHHSSNDMLCDRYWHDAFSVFCSYEHNGDIKAAVKAAAEKLGIKRESETALTRSRGGNSQADGNFCTDFGNAERFVAQAEKDCRYCGGWGKWLIWDSIRWKPDDSFAVVKKAKQVVLSIFNEVQAETDVKRQEWLAKWAIKSQARDRLTALVDLARCERPVAVEDLDSNPWLLNVKNGTLDLRTGELLPHRREDFITKLAPVRYEPAAACPRWDAFLHRIMQGNQNLTRFLQRLAGMCMTGSVSEQYLFIAHGAGANGKSVMLDTLSELLGDYAGEAPPDLFVVRRSEEHPTEIADLCGKRLVVGSETEEGRSLRTQLLKRLTGNSRIKARFMRQDYFEFTRTHKLILVTNNRPKVTENTCAVWRRIRLVPFSVVIPAAEQDKTLVEKLKSEWPGILNWALSGCLEWQHEGLQFPAEVMGATDNYQQEQDVLAEFIDECCTLSPHAFITRKNLFSTYQNWANTVHDRFPLERTALYERIRRREGIREEQKRINGCPERGYSGIGLRQPEDEYGRV